VRVFLDTNVIVGAVAARGLCADVMREALVRHDLVVCAALLAEVERVLTAKVGVPREIVADLISLLGDGAVFAAPMPAAVLAVHDEADRALVSAALNGKAELFVTGDAELLDLRETGDMAVVSPRAFWERAKARPETPKPR
jgi:putative PIN family toxin of toxin-antitoxin system